MTTRSITTKRKITPAKPVAATNKPVTAKSAAIKPVPAKKIIGDKKRKKNKKAKKESNKAGNKLKVVRDSFTMPQNDYAKIGELKQVCLKAGMHVKKSELLRAGLHALGKLSVVQLKQAVARIEQVKTGRPLKKAKI